MTATLDSQTESIVADIEPGLIEARRHLHAHPELSHQESETAQYIEAALAALGVTTVRRFGGPGVAAVIGPGNGPLVGIRGDIDALPVPDESGAPYASTRPGVLHACGHDAHTAVLLGLADVLRRLQDRMPGRVLLVFQKAEETLDGARSMIEDGLLDRERPEVMLGFHNWPLLPVGKLGWHPATAYASADTFRIGIEGVSGHGAHPHFARDTIAAAAALITNAQTVVSREIAPIEPAVVSFGSIRGGLAPNQLPDRVEITRTMRCQGDGVREALRDALVRLAEGNSTTMRVTCTVTFGSGVGPMINDPATLARLTASCARTPGAEALVDMGAGSMGAEDFSEFSARIPSAHLRVGSKLDGLDTMVHRSNFNLDEGFIAVAVRSLSNAALAFMTPDAGA